MKAKTKNAIIVTFLASVIGAAGVSLLQSRSLWAFGQAQDPSQAAVARRIGAIKAINGNAITLMPDSGPEIAVTVQPNARLLRIAPGEKDLKNATPVQLQELQVGDRILVGGKVASDGTIAATSVVVMKRTDVEARQQQDLQDWQKRGVGGLVSAVDPGAGTVTISISSFGGKKTIVVRTSKSTIIRRYAPDSVKFEDAKMSELQDVRAGDQLRARGDRNADGSEVNAEEMVTGTFPNVEGLIKSVDASAGTISVQDVLSKKTVELKITSDSQLHKIPAEMAQRFAMRLKSALAPGVPGAASSPSPGANAQGPPGAAPSGAMGQSGVGNSGGGRFGGGSAGGGGGFDLQRLLDQTPAVTLSDLHKGDAVAVLATQGTPAGGSTIVKLFSGVEPILQAAPTGSQAMMLAPWNLGGAPGGDAGP
jgi:hypothetical protein